MDGSTPGTPVEFYEIDVDEAVRNNKSSPPCPLPPAPIVRPPQTFLLPQRASNRRSIHRSFGLPPPKPGLIGSRGGLPSFRSAQDIYRDRNSKVVMDLHYHNPKSPQDSPISTDLALTPGTPREFYEINLEELVRCHNNQTTESPSQTTESPDLGTPSTQGSRGRASQASSFCDVVLSQDLENGDFCSEIFSLLDQHSRVYGPQADYKPKYISGPGSQSSPSLSPPCPDRPQARVPNRVLTPKGVTMGSEARASGRGATKTIHSSGKGGGVASRGVVSGGRGLPVGGRVAPAGRGAVGSVRRGITSANRGGLTGLGSAVPVGRAGRQAPQAKEIGGRDQGNSAIAPQKKGFGTMGDKRAAQEMRQGLSEGSKRGANGGRGSKRVGSRDAKENQPLHPPKSVPSRDPFSKSHRGSSQKKAQSSQSLSAVFSSKSKGALPDSLFSNLMPAQAMSQNRSQSSQFSLSRSCRQSSSPACSQSNPSPAHSNQNLSPDSSSFSPPAAKTPSPSLESSSLSSSSSPPSLLFTLRLPSVSTAGLGDGCEDEKDISSSSSSSSSSPYSSSSPSRLPSCPLSSSLETFPLPSNSLNLDSPTCESSGGSGSESTKGKRVRSLRPSGEDHQRLQKRRKCSEGSETGLEKAKEGFPQENPALERERRLNGLYDAVMAPPPTKISDDEGENESENEGENESENEDSGDSDNDLDPHDEDNEYIIRGRLSGMTGPYVRLSQKLSQIRPNKSSFRSESDESSHSPPPKTPSPSPPVIPSASPSKERPPLPDSPPTASSPKRLPPPKGASRLPNSLPPEKYIPPVRVPTNTSHPHDSPSKEPPLKNQPFKEPPPPKKRSVEALKISEGGQKLLKNPQKVQRKLSKGSFVEPQSKSKECTETSTEGSSDNSGQESDTSTNLIAAQLQKTLRLPFPAIETYMSVGITELHTWQQDCFNLVNSWDGKLPKEEAEEKQREETTKDQEEPAQDQSAPQLPSSDRKLPHPQPSRPLPSRATPKPKPVPGRPLPNSVDTRRPGKPLRSTSTTSCISNPIFDKAIANGAFDPKRRNQPPPSPRNPAPTNNRPFPTTTSIPTSAPAATHPPATENQEKKNPPPLPPRPLSDAPNLIYQAPTSSGKTLVAEALMFRRVVDKKLKAMYVLPFVSVVREKVYALGKVCSALQLEVVGYCANQGNEFGEGLQGVDVAVCTIEKANSLMNRMVEQKEIATLGVVVVDELHMISDGDRGYLLELFLTKLRYCAPLVQIIGMSATLPNLRDFGEWLGGLTYETKHRPVPLQEMVKVENTIYSTSFKPLRSLAKLMKVVGDPEKLVYLCAETVSRGQSVLIFCSSRKACETCCNCVASVLDQYLRQIRVPKIREDDGAARFFRQDQPQTGDKNELEASFVQYHRPILQEAREVLVKRLKKTPGGLDPATEKAARMGVGYHHAGMTVEERELVEEAFRGGVLSILVATSTLAAGVNLPVRRVIFRNCAIGCDFLDSYRYRQMAGRAGRKGIDRFGESILFLKKTEMERAKREVLCPLPPINSSLSLSLDGMGRSLLEGIVGGIVQTVHQIDHYIRSTLLAVQVDYSILFTTTKSSLSFLQKHEFIRWDSHTKSYSPSSLGAATVFSGLSPHEALTVYRELSRSRRNLVLDTELHLIYHITPIYQTIEPNWQLYLQKYSTLPPADRRVADAVEVSERLLVRWSSQTPSRQKMSEKDQFVYDIHKRFYSAIILSLLTEETPIIRVANKYGIARGQLQSLQTAAASFSGMITVFCEQLGWWDFQLLFSRLCSRVSFGVQNELLPLMDIKHISAKQARLLFDAGYKTVSAVAAAKPSDLEAHLRVSVPFSSALSSQTTGRTRKRAYDHVMAARVAVSEARRILENSDEMASEEQKTRCAPVATVIRIPASKKEETLKGSGMRKRKAQKEEEETQEEAQKRAEESEKKWKAIFASTDRSPKKQPHENKPSERKEPTNLDEWSVEWENSGYLPPNRSLEINILEKMKDLDQAWELIKEKKRVVLSTITSYASKISTENPVGDGFCDPVGDWEKEGDRTEFKNLRIDHEMKGVVFSADNGGSVYFVPCCSTCSSSSSLSKLPSVSLAALASVSTPLVSPLTPESTVSSNPLVSPTKWGGTQSGVTQISPRRNQLFPSPVRNGPIQSLPSSSSPSTSSSTSSTRSSTSASASSTATPSFTLPSSFSLSPYLPDHECVWRFFWERIIRGNKASLQEDSSGESTPPNTPPPSQFPVVLVAPHFSRQLTKLLRCGPSATLPILTFYSCRVLDPLIIDWMVDPDGSAYQAIRKRAKLSARDPALGKRGFDDVIKRWNNGTGRKGVASLKSKVGIDSWIERGGLDVLATCRMGPKLVKKIRTEGMLHICFGLEMEFAKVLSVMEFWGFAYNGSLIGSQSTLVSRRLKELEIESEELIGKRVLLTSPAQVKQVLYQDLKLGEAAEALEREAEREAKNREGGDFSEEDEEDMEEEEEEDNATKPPDGKALTRRKKKSSNAIVLQSLSSLHRFPQVVLEHRKLYSLMSKNMNVLPMFAHQVVNQQNPPRKRARTEKGSEQRKGKEGKEENEDNEVSTSERIFARFYQGRTPTGRIVVDKPNLHTVPHPYQFILHPTRNKKERNAGLLFGINPKNYPDEVVTPSAGGNLSVTITPRDALVAASGYTLLSFDYCQIELRIIAHLSRDPLLVSVFTRSCPQTSSFLSTTQMIRSNFDVFTGIASHWLGKPPDAITPKERASAKSICYGLMYGMGARGLCEKLQIDMKTATEFIADFRKKFGGVSTFIKEVGALCRHAGYIRTLFGRRRYFPAAKSTNFRKRAEVERKAVNSVCQGSAADVIKMAMVRIQKRIFGAYQSLSLFRSPVRMVLQVHDEVIVEVREGMEREVMRMVREEMECVCRLSVPLEVRIREGKKWGSLKVVTK